MSNQRGDSMDLNSIFNDAANRVNGLSIVSHTLVGYNPSTPFPRKSGNCFTMAADDGNNYRILNFSFENIKYALDTGKIEYPIQLAVLPAASKCALVHDVRIPDKWYDDNLCPVCTPRQFMPLTYHAQQAREVMSGAASESDGDIAGRKITMRVVRIGHQRVSWD